MKKNKIIIYLVILHLLAASCVSHQFIPNVDYKNKLSSDLKLPFYTDINIQIDGSYKFRDRKPSPTTIAINSKGSVESALKSYLISEFEEITDKNANLRIPINITVKELSVYYPGVFTTIFGWYMLTGVPFTWFGIPAGSIRFTANIEVELLDKTFKSVKKVSKSGSLYYNNIHTHSFWKKQKNNTFSQSALISAIEDIKSQIVNEAPFLIAAKYNKSLQYSRTELLSMTENYVNLEIRKWEKKDDFEKIAEYRSRVTSKNREKKINKLSQSYINKVGRNNVKFYMKNKDYDPDNETCKFVFWGLPPIYLNIPLNNNEARNFERDLKTLQYRNAEFGLAETGLFLKKIDIYNPKSNKSYSYSYDHEYVFRKNTIQSEFAPIKINTGEFAINVTEEENIVTIQREIDVDSNIPKTKKARKNAVAVVIGNRDYKKTSNVDFAINDAKTVKAYLIQAFGFRSGNIIYIENASKSDFEEIFGTRDFAKARLYNMIKPDESEVFIFYSGHGAPSLENNKPYLVPVGCNPSYLEIGGYSLETFYENLAKLPAKNVTVVMDACFSGVGVHKNISGSILPKVNNPAFSLPNGVLLTSSKSNQVSNWYEDQQHGLFTYFFLRAIKDRTNSDVNKDRILTYEELYKYIASKTEGIPYYSRLLNGREQNPTLSGRLDNVLLKYD